MKAATIYRLALGLFIVCMLVFGFALLPTQARAEENGYSEEVGTYSQEELAQMLAPIALYPDALLSQILMASTYPIELIEADRWRKNNRYLQDEALDDALADQYWDPSVKAICHFPDILALMSERIGETTNLGNAFLAQEEQVMDTVQQLRAAAHAHGNLASNSRQKVVVEKETIIIQPADPRIVYVPYYDPLTIYGRWWYPAYSPWYWGPPGVSIGFGIGYWPGFYFSFSFGNWSYFDWHRRYVYIDIHKRPRYVHHDRWIARPGRWQHAPAHRRGVAYRDNRTARKYGQAPRAIQYRRDTRGFPQRQELNQTGSRIDRTRLDQQGVNRQRIDRTSRARLRVESDRKQRTRIDANRSIRTQIERDRQHREQATREIRQQRQIKHSQPAATPSMRQKRQQPRDNAFNRVDQGVKERQSSERGRSSWQGRPGDTRGTSRTNRSGH